MKKIIVLLVSVLMLTALFAGCAKETASGTVSTDGSTSMEKVIGALGEKLYGKESGRDLHL